MHRAAPVLAPLLLLANTCCIGAPARGAQSYPAARNAGLQTQAAIAGRRP